MKLTRTFGLLACLFGMAWMVQAEPPMPNDNTGAPVVSIAPPALPPKASAKSILLRTQVLWLPAEGFKDFADGPRLFGLHVGRHDAKAYRFAVTQTLGGKILAEPVLITKDGRSATFVSGGEIPALAPGEKKTRADWLAFGTRLEFLPRLKSDGKIWMRFRFEQTHRVEDKREETDAKPTPGAVQTLALTAGAVSEGVATVKPGESAFAIIPDSKEGNSPAKSGGLVMVFTPEVVDKDPNVTPASAEEPAVESAPQIEIQTANTAKLDYNGRTDLDLEISETGTIESPEPIRRVSGFRADLISVSALSPQQLKIQAKQVGSTELTVTDANGRVFHAFVQVKPALGARAVKETLSRLFPAAQVDVILLNESLLLRGSVTKEEHIQQITEVAEQYAPKVLNHLKMDQTADRESGTSKGAVLQLKSVDSQPANEAANPASPETQESDVQELRQDIQALHKDVKQLIELLKHREAQAPKAAVQPFAPSYADPNEPLPRRSLPNPNVPVPRAIAPPRPSPGPSSFGPDPFPEPPERALKSRQDKVQTRPLPKDFPASAIVAVRTARISSPNDPQGIVRDETLGSGVVIESEPGKAIVLTAAHLLKNYIPGKYVLQVGAEEIGQIGNRNRRLLSRDSDSARRQRRRRFAACESAVRFGHDSLGNAQPA